MGSHWWHRSAKSSLLLLEVLNGGPIWGNIVWKFELISGFILLLFHRVLLFLYKEMKDQSEQKDQFTWISLFSIQLLL